MSGMGNIREGMQVYGSDEQLIGTVEGKRGDGIQVNGRTIPGSAIARVARHGVYLQGAGAQYRVQGGQMRTRTAGTEGEIRVPVAEERLGVGTQAVELGEVEVRKTVETERVSIPVELMREEVTVQQRDTVDRTLSAAEAVDAFQGGTIRVPVHGEEAIVTKEAVVTGEVVIDTERLVERQTVTDTVRTERVEVDEQTYQTDATATSGQRTTERTVESGTATTRGSAETSGGGQWDELREDVREGFDKARGR